MLPFIENPLKKAALEVQEYVRLTLAALRGLVTPPFYRYDIIEQLDAVGVQSLTVVLLTGFYVDNGPKLPVWDHLPTLAFWIGPSAIGVPLVLRTLLRRPRVAQLSTSTALRPRRAASRR